MKSLFKTAIAVPGILALGTLVIVPAQATPAISKHPKAHRTREKPPVITSIAPNSYQIQRPNVSGQPIPKFVTLVLSGQNFGPKSVALWNGRGLATHFLSSSKIEASVPFQWIEELTNHGATPDDWHGSARITARRAGKGSAQSDAVVFQAEAVVMGG